MFQTLVSTEHLTGMTALCNGTLKSEVSEGLSFYYSELLGIRYTFTKHLGRVSYKASGKMLIVL